MAVALLYFAYLAVLGAARRKRRPTVFALITLAAVVIIGMRHIMPLIYLLVGYWLPALLVHRPNATLEQRLLRFDRTLFGARGLASFASKAPRPILEYFELSYLLCYAVPLAGFSWLVAAGFGEEAGRFWWTVLLASFGCYGLLPWLPTRAPRALESHDTKPSLIRMLNLRVLDCASVQWNTFPSGHTAASVATALAVGASIPLAGIVLGVIAVSIAIGSVVGRYHYTADAITGVLVAVLAFVTASAAHAL
jgi:membrane-associated phospholipid phosphatase